MSRQRWAAIVVGILALLVLAPTAGAANPPAIVLSISGGFFWSTTYTVTNTGKSATGSLVVSLSDSSDEISDPSRYTVSDDTCTGKALGPGKRCSFTLTWQPGNDTTATLNVVGTRTAASQALFSSVAP